MTQSPSTPDERGELFALLLRLHPSKEGQVIPGAGNQLQAAFLDLVRQGDPQLSEWLHQPNQRRPYTLGLLQGFNHLTPKQREEAITRQQPVTVLPGQTYWLRITMLDASIFSTFAHVLISKAHALSVRLDDAHFTISRLLSSPDPTTAASSWVAYSTFADLYALQSAQHLYQFEFATPTAFSKGQHAWGKYLKLFPEPSLVFASLAKRWEDCAPIALRLERANLSSRDIECWCEENVIVSQYTLSTSRVTGSHFGQTGFQGHVTYEVKGSPVAPEARWLSTLARFAFFSGVGYKTAMGMGQTRCTNVSLPAATSSVVDEEATGAEREIPAP
jgi:CRISPR-associated endoribonuclease Cas6